MVKDPKIVKKITDWAAKPQQRVHQALCILLKNHGKMRISTFGCILDHNHISKAPLAMINNLCTNSGNAYGKVLTSDGDFVSILPQYNDLFAAIWHKD